MREIPLTNGKVALVDDNDYEWASQYAWHESGDSGSGGYAARNLKVGSEWTMASLHREIAERMGFVVEGNHVDHEDLNKLNCQRGNLRCGPESLNHFNLPVKKNSQTGVRGVCWDKSRNQWMARVTREGTTVQRRFNLFADAVSFRKATANQVYEGMSHVDL